jgi:hypothetical protein
VVAVYLLSTLETGSSRWESGLYMALFGAGLGLVLQILVLATQNEAPAADLGVATSTVTFFRTVGGSVGVALFGALFNHRIGELLGADAPKAMTPEQIAALPADQHAATAAAFADAITTVFRYAVPLLLAGFVVTWLLREVPLRTQSGEARKATDAGATERTAAPAPTADGAMGADRPALVLD